MIVFFCFSAAWGARKCKQTKNIFALPGKPKIKKIHTCFLYHSEHTTFVFILKSFYIYLTGLPHKGYLSGKSSITRLAMNYWKKKCFGLHRHELANALLSNALLMLNERQPLCWSIDKLIFVSIWTIVKSLHLHIWANALLLRVPNLAKITVKQASRIMPPWVYQECIVIFLIFEICF